MMEYKKCTIQKDVETTYIDKASEIVNNFSTKLINSQKDIDPEIVKIVNDNFWELLS